MSNLNYTIGPLGYSVRRFYVDHFFVNHLPPLLTAESRILDLGGHRDRKRGQFDIRNYQANPLYLNLSPEKGTDIIADAAQTPLPTNCFDIIICGELLEHVYQPAAVIQEAFRLLKPGGALLITIPFLYPIHADPYDFGRYTPYYWHQLLKEIGFNKITIEQQGSFHTVMVNFYKLYANKLTIPKPFGRLVRWFLLWCWIAPWQSWAMRREQTPAIKNNPFHQSFTTGLGIIAQK